MSSIHLIPVRFLWHNAGVLWATYTAVAVATLKQSLSHFHTQILPLLNDIMNLDSPVKSMWTTAGGSVLDEVETKQDKKHDGLCKVGVHCRISWVNICLMNPVANQLVYDSDVAYCSQIAWLCWQWIFYLSVPLGQHIDLVAHLLFWMSRFSDLFHSSVLIKWSHSLWMTKWVTASYLAISWNHCQHLWGIVKQPHRHDHSK